MVMGYQWVDQAETGDPAAASAVLEPLPAFVAAAQPLSAVLQPLPAFAAAAAANFSLSLDIFQELLQPARSPLGRYFR
jgi:hypothetical protein